VLLTMMTRFTLRAALATFLLITACTGPGAGGSPQNSSSDPLGTPSAQDGMVSGKVVDASGQPAAAVAIDWDMLSPPYTSTQEGVATLKDGTFKLALPPGQYRIQAGFGESAPTTTVSVQAGRTVTVELQLPGG
jgi:hypothetical protein